MNIKASDRSYKICVDNARNIMHSVILKKFHPIAFFNFYSETE